MVEGGVGLRRRCTGASPLFFNTLSGASIGDYRTAGDVKVTKYFGSYAVSVNGVISSEQDFLSRGGSVAVQLFSDDRNRTWPLQFGGNADVINPINDVVVDAKRDTLEFLVGVTQNSRPRRSSSRTSPTPPGTATTPTRVQALDQRPDHRNVVAWLTRYNQYFAAYDANDEVGLPVAATIPSAACRTCSRRPGCRRLPMGFTIDAGAALLHAERGRFLHEPALPEGLPGDGWALQRRHAAGRLRRVDGRPERRQVFREGLVRSTSAPTSTASDPTGVSAAAAVRASRSFSARWLEVDVTKTF